jgi:DNA-binding CsgD family transcriptional regulator
MPPTQDRGDVPARTRTALLDREHERKVLDDLVTAVQEGLGRTVVLYGEAGMGKTRLLEHMVASAPNLRSVSIAGVEAERDLGFAGLHRLLRPFLGRRSRLPKPQRDALGSAFGLQLETPADRFLVGLACLTLLADIAAEEGLVCVIDDAQWMDEESLGVLAFVARRLSADRIALVFGLRDREAPSGSLAGLPAIPIGGLPDHAALELLSTRVGADIDTELAQRIVVETSGCPLALLELASELSDEQLRGGRTVSEPLPIGKRLEDHFLRQVEALDDAAQTFLLVAAAETSGDASLVRRVAADMGSDGLAEDAAVASGLLDTARGIKFRHPLVRSAIYGGAPLDLRRSVHNALAANIDPGVDPDRRAQHLAGAARGPDEALANELEEAAHRAGQRGGYSAESSFLLQAAQLTPDPQRQSARLLRAAVAALNAGLPHRGEALLEQARPGLTDPLLAAEAMRLDGRLRVPLAQPPTAPGLLLAAARAFVPLDRSRARETLLEAVDAALVSQHFTVGTSLTEIAQVALATPAEGSSPQTVAGLLLDGAASLWGSSYGAAAPVLRQALGTLESDSVRPEDITSFFMLPTIVANELWDDEAYGRWVRRVEHIARDEGALLALQVSLLSLAKHATRAGRFAEAEAHYDDAVEITRAMGGFTDFYEWLKCDLYAWRGQEAETLQTAAILTGASNAIGSAVPVELAQVALATLALSSGRYADALEAVNPILDANAPRWACQVFSLGVEAGIRAEDHAVADHCLAQLEERAPAAGTPWGLGQLARARALAQEADNAEEFFVEAVSYFEKTSVATDLAHTHLLYGEWLRRENRRQDARSELKVAYDKFSAMGAEGFARRAQIELEATGEKVRRRSVETQSDLTAQEAQVARLAATGATNPEIAARLFISANTVDYHLRKVFRKLGITSRRQLSTVELRNQWVHDEKLGEL